MGREIFIRGLNHAEFSLFNKKVGWSEDTQTVNRAANPDAEIFLIQGQQDIGPRQSCYENGNVLGFQRGHGTAISDDIPHNPQLRAAFSTFSKRAHASSLSKKRQVFNGRPGKHPLP